MRATSLRIVVAITIIAALSTACTNRDAKTARSSGSPAKSSSGAAIATGSAAIAAKSAGVPPGTALEDVSGDLTIDSSQTVEGKHVKGSLYITGSNVTVSNTSVDGAIFINSTADGRSNSPVPSNISIVHVSAVNLYTVGFSHLTLDAIDLSNTRDAPHAQIYSYFNPNNQTEYPATDLVLMNSWLHGLLPSTKSTHMENLHLGGVHGVVIRNNVFDFVAPDKTTLSSITANVTLDTVVDGQFNSDVVLDGNIFHGGSYFQLYFAATGQNEVADNQFFSDSGIFTGVQYPPSQYPADDEPPGGFPKFAQHGNTLDGAPVSLPGGA